MQFRGVVAVHEAGLESAIPFAQQHGDGASVGFEQVRLSVAIEITRSHISPPAGEMVDGLESAVAVAK